MKLITCIEDTIIDRYSLTFMVIVGLPNLIVYVFVTLINKQTVSSITHACPMHLLISSPRTTLHLKSPSIITYFIDSNYIFT